MSAEQQTHIEIPTIDKWPLELPALPPSVPVATPDPGMGTIDRLAASVIPKLINKLNQAEWRVTRLEKACEYLMRGVDAAIRNDASLQQWMEQAAAIINRHEAALQTPVPAAPKKSRSRKKTPALADYADYDPDKDVYVPKQVAGIDIDGELLDQVEELGTDAGLHYPAEVLDYVDKLSDKMREAIRKQFPAPTMPF